jgi:hypothetical protein
MSTQRFSFHAPQAAPPENHTTACGYRAGKPTRAIQNFIASQVGLGGHTQRQHLLEQFFLPAKGIFLLKQKYIVEIIRLHKDIGMLALNVAHTHEYTLPREEFLNIVKYQMPDVYFSIPNPEKMPEMIVLLREPTRKELARYSMDYFRRYFWSLLFHAEIHKLEIQWDKEERFPDKRASTFIDVIGRDVFDEIRDVLHQENCLFNPDNPKEVVYEFIAYFLQFYNFAPQILDKFFPLIQSPGKVHNHIVSLGIAEENLLTSSQPEGTLSAQELLLQRDAQLLNREQDLAVFHAQYYLENIYNSPYIGVLGLNRKQFEKKYGALCQSLVQEILYNSRIVSCLDLPYVMDKIVHQQTEIDRPALLLLDRIIYQTFYPLYQPASDWQRLLIRLRTPNFLQSSKAREAKRRITQKSLAAFQRSREEKANPYLWLLWPFLFLWQVLWFVPRLILETLAALFEYHALWALKIRDRRRRRLFARELRYAARKERQGNMAAAFTYYKRALIFLWQVYRRFDLPDYASFYHGMITESWEKLKSIEERFCHEHGLTGESQNCFKQLLEFFMHSRRLSKMQHWLLLDLQSSYIDPNREYFRLNLARWLLTFGRAPLRVPLPAVALLKKIKVLNTIRKRIYQLKVREKDLLHFEIAIEAAYRHAETELRERLGPEINEALMKAGVKPRIVWVSGEDAEHRPLSSTPTSAQDFAQGLQQETIAFGKVREEILDQLISKGHTQFTDLRDIISRNHLKIDDLTGVREFLHGDQLLRFDNLIGRALEGVHRTAEMYMGAIHCFNSLLFGWGVGRWLSRYLLLPFVGGFVLFETICHIGGWLSYWNGLQKLLEPVYQFYLWEPHLDRWQQLLGQSADFPDKMVWVAIFGFTILFLLYTKWGHEVWRKIVSGIATACKKLLIETPQTLWYLPPVQFLYKLRLWSLLNTFILRPAIYILPVIVPLWLFSDVDDYFHIGYLTLIAIFIANLVIHNPIGRQLIDALEDTLIELVMRFNALVLLRLGQFIMDVFKNAVILIEDVLYAVDDFLRFRKGDLLIMQLIKGVIAKIWYIITYLFRFTVNLVVEPQINPIKHFPIVTVSHKLILPFAVAITRASKNFGIANFGDWPIVVDLWLTFVFAVIQFGIPGICGFVAWELKNNWKLYRRSAAKQVKAAAVTGHGEDVLRLLKAGFHAGAIPKLFANIRQATSYGVKSGDWSVLNRLQRQKHHLCEEISLFAEREFKAEFTNNVRIAREIVAIEIGEVKIALHKIIIPVHIDMQPEGRLDFAIHYQLKSHILFGYVRPPMLHKAPAELEIYIGFALFVFWKKSGIHMSKEMTDFYVRQEINLEKRYEIAYHTEKANLLMLLTPRYSFKVAARVSYNMENDYIQPEIVQPLFGQNLDKPLRRDRLLFKYRELTWEIYNEVTARFAGCGKIPTEWVLPLDVIDATKTTSAILTLE